MLDNNKKTYLTEKDLVKFNLIGKREIKMNSQSIAENKKNKMRKILMLNTQILDVTEPKKNNNLNVKSKIDNTFNNYPQTKEQIKHQQLLANQYLLGQSTVNKNKKNVSFKNTSSSKDKNKGSFTTTFFNQTSPMKTQEKLSVHYTPLHKNVLGLGKHVSKNASRQEKGKLKSSQVLQKLSMSLDMSYNNLTQNNNTSSSKQIAKINFGPSTSHTYRNSKDSNCTFSKSSYQSNNTTSKNFIGRSGKEIPHVKLPIETSIFLGQNESISNLNFNKSFVISGKDFGSINHKNTLTPSNINSKLLKKDKKISNIKNILSSQSKILNMSSNTYNPPSNLTEVKRSTIDLSHRSSNKQEIISKSNNSEYVTDFAKRPYTPGTNPNNNLYVNIDYVNRSEKKENVFFGHKTCNSVSVNDHNFNFPPLHTTTHSSALHQKEEIKFMNDLFMKKTSSYNEDTNLDNTYLLKNSRVTIEMNYNKSNNNTHSKKSSAQIKSTASCSKNNSKIISKNQSKIATPDESPVKIQDITKSKYNKEDTKVWPYYVDKYLRYLFTGKVLKFRESYVHKNAIKENNIIGYAYNTNNGIIRNYNEDRVTCIGILPKPKNKNTSEELIWPKISYFAIFDGHGGTSVSEWLSNNLHLYIVNQKSFPENPKAAILEAFKEAEEYILANLLTGTLAKTQTSQRKSQVSNKVPAKRKHDCSGSCALVMLIIEKECYIANLGDSRGLLSLNEMSRFYTLTNDHKPEDIGEKKRIEINGGKIWKQGFNPFRVIPGGLSVRAYIINHFNYYLFSVLEHLETLKQKLNRLADYLT